MTRRADARVEEHAADMMPDGTGRRRNRKEDARDERHARGRRPKLRDVERQHRPEAAIDELQAEDHRHQQDEILEREDVPERHRGAADAAATWCGAVRSSYITNTRTSATT